MPRYYINGDTYNIPDDVVADFERDNPDAKVEMYVDRERYRLPISEKAGFMEQYPNATYEIVEKTMIPGNSPTFSMAELQSMAEQGNDEKSTDVFQPSAGDIAKFHAQRKQMENSLQQQHDAFSERYRNLQEYNTHVGNGQAVESGVQFNPKTKEAEKTYITPLGNKTTDKAVADAESQHYRQSTDMTVGGQLRKAGDRLTRLKAKAEARRAEIKEEWEQNQSKAGGLGKFLTELKEQHSGLSNVDALIDADDEYNALRAAIHQTEEQIGTLERQHDRDKGIDVGFWRGFGDVVGNPRTWDFGMGDLRDAVTMVKASSDNTDKTDGVKAAEQELLQSAYDNEQTQSQYGGNDDFWYRAGTMTGHMPTFIVDFAATGGGFGAIKVATKGAAKYATKAVGKEVVEEIAKLGAIRYVKDNGVKGLGQYATNWTIKALGATADDLLIRAPLMANTIQLGKTASDIIDRKLGDVVVNEDGSYDFSNDKTWGSAIWQGEANAVIEDYSEMFGKHLDKIFSLRNMSELANVIGAKRIGAVLSKADAGALSGIMGKTHQLFNKMGVSGYFGEVGEEYYGQMWRTMLNLDDAYQQNPDGTRTNLLVTGQFNGDIWGGMALSMGLMGAGKHTLTGAQYVSMKHGVNKADAHATELLGKEVWEPLRATIDLTTNDDIGSVAEGIVNDKDITDDERAAVLTYMERSLMMRGFNLGTLARKRGGEQDEDVQAMDESYIDGYNIRSAQEMADAKNMYEQQRKKLEEMLPMEAVEDIDRDPLGALGKLGDDATTNEAVIDYINAKQVRDGMIQRVRDDIDGQIERSNAMIDARTNRTTGMIQGATMKQDDRRVYVVSGTVVPYNDGSGIDKAKSSSMIIVRDAESGKLEPVSADAILGVDAPLNPADEKAIAAEAIREQIAQEAADKIDGVVTFNPGDTYTITGDDAQIQVQVVVNEEGIVDNGDGTVNVSDGTNIFPLAKATIQQQVEEANLARVAQFEQQRAIENAERRKALTPKIAMPEYVMNDKVTLRDADGNIVNGAIEEVNADGVVFAIDNPITKMWNTRRYKKEDFDSQIISIERDGKELWKEQAPATETTKKEINNSEDFVSLQNKTENDEVSERISQGDNGTVSGEAGSPAGKIQDAAIRCQESRRAYEAAHEGGGRVRTERSWHEVEAQDIETYAKESGQWLDYTGDVMQLGEPGPSGNENDTYISPTENAIYKVNNLMNSKDISSLLEKVALHNRYFPNTTYELAGFTGFGRGNIYPVLKQDLIHNAEYATPEEIDSYMRSLGFEPTDEYEYSNNEVTISDLRPRNVLKDADGDIYVVDAEFKAKDVDGHFSKVDENRPQTALERMPKDEQGNPIYEQTDSDTAWDAIVEQTEGDEVMAQTVADGMVADKEAVLKKLEKTKSKGGVSIAEKIAAEKERKAAIDAAQQELNIWKKIASVHSERNKAAQWAAEAEAKRAALEKERISAQEKAESESAPRNYAKAYDTWGTPMSFRDYLLRAISSRNMMFRWKDSGNGTGGLGNHLGLANSNEERRKRMWLIDEVNGFYPEEAAEYALTDYKTQTGMNPNMDTSDALNEILDILGSYDNAKSMWDEAKQIHDRIEFGEIAPQMSDEYEERYQWYMDNLHASPEDYEAYMETMLSEDIVLSEEDYNNLISEYIDGQGTIQAESERSNQILQGTQPVPTTGTGTIPTESSEVGERVNSEDGTAPADNRQDVVGRSLTADEAESLIIGMEERAEIAPDVELTIENWDALFGEEGKVITPIGVVKMGENQFTKLMRQGRDGKLGMIKPTLEHPHAIVEDESEAKEDDVTERASSYVFIRSFKKTDGSRYYYFTSVTVSKDGKEVVISNQEKRRKAIANLLINGKLVWKHADDVSTASDVADGLYSSQGNLSDPTTEGTVAPQTNVSDDKVTPNSPNSNELGEKAAEVSEKLWKVTNFLNYKYGYNFETENDFYNWIVKKKKTLKNIRSWLAGKLSKDLVSECLTTILEYGKLNAEVSTSQHQYTPTLSQESEQVIDQDTAPYSIVPAQYTTKKGKVLDMHLLKFSENLTKEQQRAAKELAKIDKGWYDREQGGFMMRSEEDAKRLAETVLHNGDAVKDAQPISIADIKAVNDGGVISAESQQSDVTSTKEKPGYTIKKNDKGIYPYSVTFDDNAFNIHQNEDVTAAAVAMGGIKRPESFGGGYSFKDKNAAVAFAQSMTKEKPQQNQSASSQENGQDLTTGSSIDIDAESTAKVTINPYGAKYELNNLVHKYAGQRKTRGFISDLASALGDRASKQTYYFEFKDKAGNVYTLRISNHNVNANNADENEKEISIVIKSRRQPNKFIPSNAYIKEYVYFKESIANGDGQTLAWIAQDIATMLDTGVYADNSGVAVINTSPIREEAVKEETNPSGNRLVTDERYAELCERMRKKLGGQMNIGIDPEILAIGTEMAVYHLEKGARKFTEYAKAMIADLGDAIRPYLKAFYNGARNLPEVESSEIAADMSSYDEVQTIDVANFDKPGIDALATAETVAREAEVEQEVEIAQERIKKNRNKQTAEDAISAYIKNFNGAKYLDIEVFNNPDELYEFIIEDGDSETDARTFVNSVSTDRKAGGYDPYTNKILIFAWNNTNYYVSLFHEHCHSAISDLGGIKRFAMLANELAELKPKINRQIRQHYAKDWQEEIITYSLEDGLRNDSMDSIRKDLSTEARSLLDEILIHTGYERKQNGKDYISRFEPGGRTLSLHELRDPLDKRLSSKASGEKTRDSRDASDGNIGIGFGRGGQLAYREDNGRKENPRRIKGGGRQNERSTRLLTQEDKIVTRQSGHEQGSLFDETLINDNEDGLQRTDAVRTEGLPSDNNLNAGTRSEKISSQEVRQDGRGTDGIRVGRSGRTIDDVSQGNGRPAGRLSGITEKKNTHNNHSERGKDHAPTSVDARIEANIKAIELAKQLLESGEKATEKQMQTLRKFSGWGGLGKAFNERANYTHEGRHYYNEPTIESRKLRELLGEKAYQEAVMSANSAYYTPAYVVDTLWDIAEKMGFEGGNILEGSAGIGNILGQMPTHISERSNIHAIEIDGTSGDILSLLYPDANVEIQGFEQTHIANGSVDLAITNVPFVTGLRVNDTTGDKDLSKKFHNIHDFCIAKNVRKLREGGLGIFITSNGTLDNSKKLRDWIVNEGGADFVGAFRMHNKTFGGTGVTSDIIVIRKRVNGQKSANAIDVSTVTGERVTYYDTGEMRKKNGKATPVIKLLSMDYNRYFIEHPENMAGEMHFAFEKGDRFRPTSKGLYPKQDKKQEQMLAEFVQSFTAEDAERLGTHIDTRVVEVVPDKKIGEMFVKDGKLYINSTASAQLLEVNANKVKGHTKVECFEAYTAIKEALAEVLAYQTGNESDEGLKPLLDNLNRAYDDFVATYGHFNKNTAIAFLRNDVDYANVSSVETFEELGDGKGGVTRTFGLADVMKGRVVEKEKEPTPTNVKDGIIASIFKSGRVDIPYIAEQLGTGIADVKKEIIESGYGFENPATRQIEASYQYLSGNVREKLRQAEENNENGTFDRNIKALQEVMPMEIPAHLIDFTLGSSWIDPKLYDEYVKERTEVAVQFTSVGGTWFMKEPYFTAYEKNRAMGVTSEMLGRTVMGHTLIEAAIQNRSVTVSTTKKNWDGSTETITDKEATQACAAKIDEIRQDFKDWARQKMQSDPEMSAEIERIYNDTFNNFVPMSIPDEFAPEHFPGANPKIKMYAYQSRAIVRGIQQPLLLAHEVGTGKTFTLISTAMEMRRLGTARKPMIVVQNATVGQFVASAKELYPNAKILTLEEADRGAEGRKNFYAKIRYNDWDMIVVPQSTFEFIPDSEEREMAFVQDKIEEKMLILEKMKEEDPDGKSMITRQAEREIELLEEQLAGISDKASKKRTANDEKKRAVALQNAEVKAMEMLDRRTDDVENFDDMGIDALLVDEAHEYKHLGFATAMQRGVKGVDQSYSKKSQGVFLKTQAVLEKNNGRNVIFATGTPISNTAAEIWTFMRYLMPADTMKEYGIYYFDDFVRNFGNIQQMLEFNTSGKFKENNRFSGYVNLPELVRIWSGVSDTVLTKEAVGVSDKIPEMEGGKAQDLYLPQTRALRGIMKFVKGELEKYDKMSGKEKKENSHIPLTMYGIAKAAAVDARLVQADAEDDEHSKTNEAVRQTLRSLQDTADYKGTVAIFADNYQNKHSGFNIYDDIRDKLIAEGVPADEIVVMRSGMTVKKKLEIFEKVNRGEVRVILGSTATLGTGVNIQERLHTLIHLDAPNRPMDYTQRNGRILRQGNLHKAMGKPVRILRFGVEDSLDVTAYQRLKTKGAIADSIMNGKQMMSNSMTNRVLEEEEDVFGDTVAQLSGSEYAMLRNNAEKNMRKYASRKKQYEADQTYIHNAKPRVKAFIKDAEKRIEDNSRYLEAVRSSFPDGKFKEIVIGKHRFASVEAMADYFKEYNKSVLAVIKQMKDGDIAGEQKRELTIQIGDFANSAISAALSKSGTSSDLHSLARGFSFVVTTKLTRQTMRDGATLFNDVDRKMTYSCAELGIEDIPVRQNLLRNAIEDITHNVVTGRDFAERLEAAQRSKKHNEAELEQLLSREGKPFEYEEELAQAKAQFEEYAELMKKELAEKEAKYAEMDATVEAANNLDNAEEDDVLYRKADEEYDIKAQYGLLGAGTTAIIENESDLLMLKDVIQESDYNLLKESFYHPNKYGVSIPSLRIAVVFANKAPYPESTWWHENTHIVYNGLQLEDKEECGLAALEWLRKQGRRGLVHYNLVVQNYDKEQWAEEATSRMIQYLIERYGTERFLDADFGGNEKVSKLASTIRNKFLYGTEKPTERDILQRERYIEHGSYTYNRGDNGGSYKGTWSVSSNRRQSEGGISQASEGSGGAQGADASGLARESAGSYGDDATKNRIEALFNQAISGEFKGKSISIGTLTDEGKAYLEQISGVAFKDKVDFVLNPSDLVHIYKDHFGNNEKDQGQNIPLDIEDIRSLADVITMPDKVVFFKEGEGSNRNMFYFFKEAENGTYNLMEIYSDRKGNLTAKTFYKTRKDASQRVMDIEKSLLPTSETYFGAILSDAKIPQMFETPSVEDNYSREGVGAYTDDEVSFENDPISKVLGKPRGTRKQRREFAQRERQRMVERVESLAKRLHLDNVEIVTNASALTTQRQRAKGYYLKSTGKITIVVPNHTSTFDVEQTLLHEAVAHYGLRQLFGEHFDTFLDNVFNNADEAIRRRIVDIRKDLYRKYVQNAIKGVTSVFEQAEIIANLPKNEVDFTHTATEEYLASLAENTNFEALGRDGSWWLKIKRLFLDMLEKIGFEGFSGVTLSDNELRYLLWRSYENLAEPGRHRSILGEAADVAMQYELKVGNYAMPSTPTAKVADEDLNAVNERFNEELQQQIDGTLPKGHIYQMGMPGDVLLATGIAYAPIQLNSHRLLDKSSNFGHDYDLSELKDLVKAINNPIAIFAYGDKSKAQNIVVEIHHEGKNFIVGLSICPTVGGQVLDINSVRNVFPKDNAEWLNWITQGKALYLDKERVQDLINQQRTNLADVEYLDLNSIANIIESFENPTILQENNTGDSDDVLYRDGDSGSAREEYDRRVRRMRKANPDDKKATKRTNRAATAHEALLDGMRALRVLQEAVAHESGKPVEDFEDAYMHENHLSSRNKTAEEAYQRDYFKPLVAEIIKVTKGAKKAYKELVRYIIAKHGLERNSKMAESNAKSEIEAKLNVLQNALKKELEKSDKANKRYNKSVELFEQNQLKGNILLGEPSSVLKACGINASDLFLTPKTLKVHLAKHKLTTADVRNLPKSLENPIMVYKWGTKAKSMVVVTQIPKGEQRITIAIKLERGGKRVEINEIASVHGKESARFINEMINAKEGGLEASLKYVNKENALDWLGLVPPKGTAPKTQQERIAKVIESFKNPDTTNKKIERIEHAKKIVEASLNGIERNLSQSDAQKWYNAHKKTLDSLLQNGKITDKQYNKRLEKINTIYSGGILAIYRNKDYAGLTALTGMDNVADAEAEAQRMVADYEQAHDTKELWKRITAATSKTLKTRYEGGLLSKDMYEQISSQYKYYIPLKGWEETTAMDIYEYDAGRYRISPALMKAYGRKSVSDDPFATIMTDALRTIMESNRNRMKQKFLNLALNHPTDLLSVSRQWYVKQADGSWLPDNPIIPDDADADTVDAIVKQHEADMQKLHAQGKAETHRGGLNLGVVAKDADTSQHVVRVKRNGETFCIYVNGDPRAARAINGMLNPDAGEQTKIKKIAQWLKDKFAKVLTTWNLEFMFRNLCRDVMMAETAVLVKENKEYAKLYTQNVASILKFKLPQLLYKWEHGTLDDDIEIERLFREFLENGGETGFIQLNSVENVKRDMQRFLRESQSGVAHIPLKLWRGVWDGIEFMNRSAEDITRFAVYVTSRQQGRTVVRSVHDAKEITVNFNRKGSGEYGVKYLGFLYLFFNASIQAAANAGRLVKNNPIKASIAMAFFLSAGFLLPMASCILAALCGDDEDDYWDLPEWTRRNNLVLYIPFWGKYLTYPIAHELRPFYGIGEIAFSIMCGKETMEDGIRKAAEMLTGIQPIDYTGNGGDAIVNFSPSLAQPVVQVYRNTDYFGKPIYKKTPWNANDPEWTKAYRNTTPILVEATRMLSEAGATTDEYGVISYPEHIYTGDINPAIIEHLLESYTGGLGKTVNGATKTILMYWNEDYRELRNVPVLRTVIQSPDERAEERRFNNEYFKLYNEYKESKEYLRKLTALDKDGVMGAADRVTRWIGSDAGKRHLFLDDSFKWIKELEREMEECESDDYIRERYEQKIDSVKHELVNKAS